MSAKKSITDTNATGGARSKKANAKTTSAKHTFAKQPATTPAASRNAATSTDASRANAGVRARRYWLVKTEPESFSMDDLMSAPGRTAHWDGVRNYQARNTMRDDMKLGDLVFIYHSSAEPPAVAGIAQVVREGYPDHTAFDPEDSHFDAKSDPTTPTWMMVDVRAVERFATPVSLPELRETRGLDTMVLLQRGSRLSVQPVSAAEWEIVAALGRRQSR